MAIKVSWAKFGNDDFTVTVMDNRVELSYNTEKIRPSSMEYDELRVWLASVLCQEILLLPMDEKHSFEDVIAPSQRYDEGGGGS